jgi:hypothetical protein
LAVSSPHKAAKAKPKAKSRSAIQLTVLQKLQASVLFSVGSPTSVSSELQEDKQPSVARQSLFWGFLCVSVAPKKQNLWLLETKDLAYPNTEAKNRPAQPSFFPHQTGRAQSVAPW